MKKPKPFKPTVTPLGNVKDLLADTCAGGNMNLTYENFPEVLRKQVVGFDLVYEWHVQDYDEVLPYVLMGDLGRFLTKRVRQASVVDPAVQTALTLLASAAKSDDRHLQNLVASLVEKGADDPPTDVWRGELIMMLRR